MVKNAALPQPLFAPPRIIAEAADSGGPIVLRTEMGAGHAGAPGRFDRLEEIARAFAFAIAVANGQIGHPSPLAGEGVIAKQ